MQRVILSLPNKCEPKHSSPGLLGGRTVGWSGMQTDSLSSPFRVTGQVREMPAVDALTVLPRCGTAVGMDTTGSKIRRESRPGRSHLADSYSSERQYLTAMDRHDPRSELETVEPTPQPTWERFVLEAPSTPASKCAPTKFFTVA